MRDLIGFNFRSTVAEPSSIWRAYARELTRSFAQHNLTPDEICRSISHAAPVGVAEPLALCLAGMAADHVIELQAADADKCPSGPLLERSMMPPAKSVTLLNGKVSTQVG